MSKKVIITGVNGFVGEHVVDAFRAEGFEVIGVGYDANPSETIVHKVSSYIRCNLVDMESVAQIDFSDVWAIVHLAGLSNVGESFNKPLPYINDNPSMAYNLLEHARTRDFQGRTIVVSSGALYNPQQPLPLTEDSRLLENSPYAVGKLGVEHVANYYRLRGLDVVVVRPFNHIGPNQNKGFLVPDLFAQLQTAQQTNATSISVGNLATRRDYTDVRDIARAYRLIALADNLNYSLYNICTGRSLAGTDILQSLQAAMGVLDIEPIIDETKVRPTDIMEVYGDASRLTSDTAWAPQIPIEQTIHDFIQSQE